MRKIGITQKKSFTMEWPILNIDPKLLNHFIRGMIDGDGCLSKFKKSDSFCVHLVNSVGFCEAMKEKLAEIGFDFKMKRENQYSQPMASLWLFGNVKCKIFLDWLYKDSSLFLERKKDKYDSLTRDFEVKRFKKNKKGYTLHKHSGLYLVSISRTINGKRKLLYGKYFKTNLDGSLLVSLNSGINIDSLNISGINVNTDQLETINTSGAQYLASISGRLNNGLIGVTGTRPDIASGYATGYYVMVGGRAVEIASGFNPQYGSGQNAMLNIARDNGALLTQNTDLNYVYDSISTYPAQSSVVSNSTISGSFAAVALQTGIALAANTGRKSFFIQNTSSVANLFVKLGSPPTSSGNFSLILNKSSEAGAGGGSFTDDRFLGAVSISGNSFICWELT